MHAANTQSSTTEPSPILTALIDHVDSHFHGGERWPDDAQFSAVWRTSTWPIGWSDMQHTDFFTDRASLEAWMAKQKKWAELEDNYIAWVVYEWDLGPQRLSELDRSSGNV